MILDLDAAINKSHVALALGKSQQAVSKLAQKIGVDASATNGDLVVAIVERLTEEASGRGGEDQKLLTKAKIKDTIASAELRELQVSEKAGTLVDVSEIEPQLTAMITAARQELLTLPEKIASDVKSLHGIEVDMSLIQERIYDALNHLATGLHADDASNDVASEQKVAAST